MTKAQLDQLRSEIGENQFPMHLDGVRVSVILEQDPTDGTWIACDAESEAVGTSETKAAAFVEYVRAHRAIKN